MTTATLTAPAKASARAVPKKPGRLTLDTLHNMTFAELDALYRSAPAPDSIAALDGEPQGRMLALKDTKNGPLAKFARNFSQSANFPWMGKNFTSLGKDRGEGINRINLLGRARRQWFRFETSFQPSLIDGKPCFQLDYGLASNPPGIRHIIDELREVDEGLYLGPAQLVIAGREPVTVLYFGISQQ